MNFCKTLKISLVHGPARNTINTNLSNLESSNRTYPPNSSNDVIYIKTERQPTPPDTTYNMGSLTAEIEKMKKQMENLDRRLHESGIGLRILQLLKNSFLL